ncbi:MAG: TetR/AcrR family transcriptional regulator [Proteobacteria bacterium]|nr:TetR/AcrR family transcriptional regulator [Pseudomonadota bacterium]MBU1581640.1 TetR/AcrR family transcriptional regulator [Pseudomonadota bacterium]MBU2455603.1 TetR/AcrR family transcriptional regulator [Pseudomonadota bacterium]MBU2631100.1 TetR/AcrR family transcriptional regulator [Pseudomonadota bacterium]
MGINERRVRERKIRRKKILEAAKVLFFEQGFSATSMNQIARKVELSKGTLYLYFKNKEELYTSLLLEGMALLNTEFAKAVAGKTIWVEKLRSIGWAYYQFFLDHQPFFHINFQFHHGEITKNISDDLFQKCYASGVHSLNYISNAVAEGMSINEIHDDDPMSVAIVLWGSLTGIILLHEGKDHRKFIPDSLEKLIEKSIDILIQGLKK